MTFSSPPATETELVERAGALTGLTLGALAARVGVAVPDDLRRAKGWPGNLMESVLGATARSRAEPDFLELGVELKTLPVNRLGVPLETTFVCTIPLLDIGDTEWRASRVFKKLRRVLWVPVMAERRVAVTDRVVGAPLLWSPTEEQEQALRWDWEELAGMIGRGQWEDINGRLGAVMQVRPKAADSRSRRRATDAEGCALDVLPRGFYLRTSFTAAILRRAFVLPRSEYP